MISSFLINKQLNLTPLGCKNDIFGYVHAESPREPPGHFSRSIQAKGVPAGNSGAHTLLGLDVKTRFLVPLFYHQLLILLLSVMLNNKSADF